MPLRFLQWQCTDTSPFQRLKIHNLHCMGYFLNWRGDCLYNLHISWLVFKRCKSFDFWLTKQDKRDQYSSVSDLSMDENISLLQHNGRKLVGSSFWESVNNSNHAQRITSYFSSFKTLQPEDEHNFVFLFQTVTSFIVRASLTTPQVYLKRWTLWLVDKWHLISRAHCLRRQKSNK